MFEAESVVEADMNSINSGCYAVRQQMVLVRAVIMKQTCSINTFLYVIFLFIFNELLKRYIQTVIKNIYISAKIVAYRLH